MEFICKQDVIKGSLEWYFIGSFQIRKVKVVVDCVFYIYFLDRLLLVKEIEKWVLYVVCCFVQVNILCELFKYGLKIEEVIFFIREFFDFRNIFVEGLMMMVFLIDDIEMIRVCFW